MSSAKSFDGDIFERIQSRLMPSAAPLGNAKPLDPEWISDVAFNDPLTPAAVLIALVKREDEITVLYTRRAGHLRSHSGQVAFPGGKIDPDDAGAAEAAIREAQEEVALVPEGAKVLGYMKPFTTGTNYVITPVVARVEQHAPFVANPGEVDDVFEVPLDFIRDEANYGRYKVELRGKNHSTWQLSYAGFTIWGITAYLTRTFRDIALRKGEFLG